MQQTFKTYREDGGNVYEIEATVEFGIMHEAYGVRGSPDEWFCDPVKVAIEGVQIDWDELSDFEREDIEFHASIAYTEAQDDYEAWLEDQARNRD